MAEKSKKPLRPQEARAPKALKPFASVLRACGDLSEWGRPGAGKLGEPARPPQQRQEPPGRPPAVGAPFSTEPLERFANFESRTIREIHDVVGKVLIPLERARLLDLRTGLNCVDYEARMTDEPGSARPTRKNRKQGK